jgi:hypothetical protein
MTMAIVEKDRTCRMTTISMAAIIAGKILPSAAALRPLIASLPAGYSIAMGGSIEEATKAKLNPKG